MNFEDLIKANYSNDELGDLRHDADLDPMRSHVNDFLALMATRYPLAVIGQALEEALEDLWEAVGEDE